MATCYDYFVPLEGNLLQLKPSHNALHIDPFHICGNAAKLEDKTKEMFTSVKQSYCSVLQFDCIPTDVKGVYRYVLIYIKGSNFFANSCIYNIYTYIHI